MSWSIAKSVFQVHGINEIGQPVFKRRPRRADVLRLFSELEPALVGIEACHAGHHIRRLLIHGARAIVGWRKRSMTRPDPWIPPAC